MLGVYYGWSEDRGFETTELGIYDADKLEQAKKDVLQWVITAKADGEWCDWSGEVFITTLETNTLTCLRHTETVWRFPLVEQSA